MASKQTTIRPVVNMLISLYTEEVLSTDSTKELEEIKSFSDFCKEKGFPDKLSRLTATNRKSIKSTVRALTPVVDLLSKTIVNEARKNLIIAEEESKANQREYVRKHKTPYDAEKRRESYLKKNPHAKVRKCLTDEEKAAIQFMCEMGHSISYMQGQINRPYQTVKKYIEANVQGYKVCHARKKQNTAMAEG